MIIRVLIHTQLDLGETISVELLGKASHPSCPVVGWQHAPNKFTSIQNGKGALKVSRSDEKRQVRSTSASINETQRTRIGQTYSMRHPCYDV